MSLLSAVGYRLTRTFDASAFMSPVISVVVPPAVTGDINADASNVLVKRYPTALKSDIVQIAHHANTGATKAFYQAVDPTVALWPTSEKLFKQMTSEDGRIAHIMINRYVYLEMNVKENYTNGEYSVELKLPYVLGSAIKHQVSTTDQYK